MGVYTNKRVPESEVLAVPEPPFTKTWHPIGHSSFINVLQKVVDDFGWKIADRSYSLSANQNKMFGVWELEEGSVDRHWAIGFRNSIDKSIAVGLVAGLRVFVCDNMVFSGEFIELRKHTKKLDESTLEQFCLRAIIQLKEKLIQIDVWIDDLKKIPLSRADAEHITFQAMRTGVIPINQFLSFYDLYFSDQGRWFLPESNAYQFHSACTELMKEDSLFLISQKNAKLATLFKDSIKKPSFFDRILRRRQLNF